MQNEKSTIHNTLGMFDLLKGIVMIMVMLSHTEGVVIYEVINQGNAVISILFGLLGTVGGASMPLLFILSGYGYRKTTFKKCVKKQFDSLIIPYSITAVIVLGLHVIFHYLIFGGASYTIKRTFNLMGSFLLGIPKDTELLGILWLGCGPIWFLLALFWGLLIFNLISNLFDGKKLLFIAFFISCIGWVLGFICIVPWCIRQGFVATLYICIGYLAKKYKLFINEKTTYVKIFVMMLLFIIPSLVILYKVGDYDMAGNRYPLGPVSIVLTGGLGFLLIAFFVRLNWITGFFSDFIRRIGRYSLYVICIHSIEFKTIGEFLQYIFIKEWKGSLFIRSLIIFVVRIVSVLFATWVFIKAKDYYYVSTKQHRRNSQ